MKQFLSAFCLGFPEVGRKPGCALDPKAVKVLPLPKAKWGLSTGQSNTDRQWTSAKLALTLQCLLSTNNALKTHKGGRSLYTSVLNWKAEIRQPHMMRLCPWIKIQEEAETRQDHNPSLCRSPTKRKRALCGVILHSFLVSSFSFIF